MSAHAHDHGHAHAGHAPGVDAGARDRRALSLALAITAVVLLAEVAGGLLSGSLALLADAAHMATDAAGLGLALWAASLARRSPTRERTFGFRRAEVLAALANGVVLGAASIYVVVEAIGRIGAPPPVEGRLMLAVSTLGLVANLTAAAILARGGSRSLNVRGALLHVLGDALGSVGAIAAAGAILAFGWSWADPAIAIAIAGLILLSAWRLVRESLDVLMEATPEHVDLDALVTAMRAVPGVVDMHDLHVWTLTSGFYALSAHVDVVADADGHAVLHILSDLASNRFGVAHTTFQLERVERLLQIEGVGQ
jgi:cobalt-zinc-cadmium efflux system protein